MRPSLLPKDLTGIHYAIRIFVGTALLWVALAYVGDTNPLWAVISLIVVTEPQMVLAWLAFKGRIINTIAGCIIGMFFLLVIHQQTWLLPIAVTIAALISTYVIKIPVGWRVGPITTAIIISAGIGQKSIDTGLSFALHRTMEVLLGSATALFITWITSLIWFPSTDSKKDIKT